jgi:predicted ATP-grasp superfamily ATP-dependent carboligase
VLGLIATWRGVEETRTAEARLDSSLGGALKAYLVLLRDWHYLGLVFIGGCAMAGFLSIWRARPLCSSTTTASRPRSTAWRLR